MQVPTPTIFSVNPDAVHTLDVLLANEGVTPDGVTNASGTELPSAAVVGALPLEKYGVLGLGSAADTL
ncbi:hypothetical protein R1T40_13965 [Tritonibacter scottomollicae]|uniref:Uncharacterized protein n=1 Tax=Tritonibacter scottomollicae TaxID=483013 RepID=A0ABZ0HM23_TRISK|nr:hypothetical protein R1T40_13965 [Tritonibacter scottomollicae]